MQKSESVATKIAVMRGEVAEAQASLVKRQKEHERLQQEIDRMAAGISFMQDRLRILELSGGVEGSTLSSEFAGQSLETCIKTVLDENRKPMRLVDVTKELLQRGFQTKAKQMGFTTSVLRALKRSKGQFVQTGKLWTLKASDAAVPQ